MGVVFLTVPIPFSSVFVTCGDAFRFSLMTPAVASLAISSPDCLFAFAVSAVGPTFLMTVLLISPTLPRAALVGRELVFVFSDELPVDVGLSLAASEVASISSTFLLGSTVSVVLDTSVSREVSPTLVVSSVPFVLGVVASGSIVDGDQPDSFASSTVLDTSDTASVVVVTVVLTFD
ncbi:hypothetical protein BG842_25060 [Haladaptatus sp. W1]|nr:hypothetical protein BG842_25060 [Haladaptatus sp. W1]